MGSSNTWFVFRSYQFTVLALSSTRQFWGVLVTPSGPGSNHMAQVCSVALLILIIIRSLPAYSLSSPKATCDVMRAVRKALLAALMTSQLVFDHDKASWKIGYFLKISRRRYAFDLLIFVGIRIGRSFIGRGLFSITQHFHHL